MSPQKTWKVSTSCRDGSPFASISLPLSIPCVDQPILRTIRSFRALSCLNPPFMCTTLVFSIPRVRTDRYCTQVSQFINKWVWNLEIYTRLKCLILCKTVTFLMSFYEFNRYI